jgi:hypothetical protein
MTYVKEHVMGTSYEKDAALWAAEQGALLRTGRLSEVDLTNVAEEIEAMGRSERRELASRMSVLLAHLLKWKYQPGRRSDSWRNTIREQRSMLRLLIKDSPSLKPTLADPEWTSDIWENATASAADETGLNIGIFPATCLWATEQTFSQEFYPE